MTKQRNQSTLILIKGLITPPFKAEQRNQSTLILIKGLLTPPFKAEQRSLPNPKALALTIKIILFHKPFIFLHESHFFMMFFLSEYIMSH